MSYEIIMPISDVEIKKTVESKRCIIFCVSKSRQRNCGLPTNAQQLCYLVSFRFDVGC